MPLDATKLPRIFPGFPMMDKDGNVSVEFTRYWNTFADSIDASVTSINSQLVQLNTIQSATTASQAQANMALTIADGGGTPGSQSGSNSVSSLSVAQACANGTRVDLTSVAAGNLTFNLSFTGGLSTLNPVSDTGSYRIQEIVGALETTVFTGNLYVIPTGGYAGIGWIIIPGDGSISSWSGVNFPQTSTGAVSYRLDFILNSITFTLQDINLYVRRS